MVTVIEEIKAIGYALMGGARYGVKIRLPHALVMTVLFRNDLNSTDKIKSIMRLTWEHAANLAAFATIYKTVLAIFKAATYRLANSGCTQANSNRSKSFGRLLLSLIVNGPYGSGQRLVPRPPGHPERHHHALIAGAIGGYLVWGRYSSVNYQIVLYLTSRVLVGLGKRFFATRDYPTTLISNNSSSSFSSYPLFAAAVWGIVMMLFEETPEHLQSSLRKSMNEIYRYNLPKGSSPPLRASSLLPTLQ